MSAIRDAILEYLNDDEKVIFLEGDDFDAAIVGVIERFGQPYIVCYDFKKVIDVMVKQGMSEEEAHEYYGFNTLGAWMGEETPCFLHHIEE